MASPLRAGRAVGRHRRRGRLGARLWDAVTGETLTVYPGQRAAVMAAVTTADEVVTLASDGAVRHFARRADGPSATGVGHGELIPTVRWSPDGTSW